MNGRFKSVLTPFGQKILMDMLVARTLKKQFTADNKESKNSFYKVMADLEVKGLVYPVKHKYCSDYRLTDWGHLLAIGLCRLSGVLNYELVAKKNTVWFILNP